MVGRRNRNEPYQIVGWSFRLFPHFTVAQGPPNRGSAFNSCLSMSSVPGPGQHLSRFGERRTPFPARRGPGAGLSGASGYLTARETYNPPRG